MDLHSSTTSSHAHELARSFSENPSLIKPYLDKLFAYMEQKNPQLNALTSLQKESAYKRAEDLQRTGPSTQAILYGVPIVIKENIQKIGFPVECASKILKGYKGQFDATAVSLLEQAGAILIATANMDEFAMGSSNQNSCHGPVRNPHDTALVSGGSSGGSAAACSAGFAPVTLGSDTGGSVREPAAFCGIYGFKPSYGRISRFGLVAYGSSLDQISPFARCPRDIDMVMQVLGHADPHDATTLPGSYQSLFEQGSLSGKRIGIMRSLLNEGVDASVKSAFCQLEGQLIQEGAVMVDIDLKAIQQALSAYYITVCAEASSNLSRFDGMRFGYRAAQSGDLTQLYSQTRAEGFGIEVKKRILLGAFALSTGYYDAYYGKAQAVRARLTQEFKELFQQVDFIYWPTTPAPAFAIGSAATSTQQEYLYDVFTVPANLAGLPAISVPAPVAAGALPIGLHFMAAQGCDAQLIAFAGALERKQFVGHTIPQNFCGL